MADTQSPQDYFRLILLTVMGQAFDAAGYQLEERPAEWAGGTFRFSKHLDSGSIALIEFQLLAYSDTTWSSGMPSRFRVTLTRDGLRRSLSELVVADFRVAILPSADHWWTFKTTDDLGKALAEAGHLIVGFGMPWLSGDLEPPSA